MELNMENEVRLILPNNLYDDILKVVESDVNFNNFKNKTVLITGAGELLGFYLACAALISNDLYSTNISVIAVDKNDDIFKKYGKLTYREDIEFIVSENLSGFGSAKADFIIHTKTPESDKEITGVLDYIKLTEAQSVICSGSEIYGDVFNGKDKISETDMGYCDSFKPDNLKIQLERALESAAQSLVKENLDIKLVRLSKVFGALAGDKQFIRTVRNVITKSDFIIDEKDGVLESFIYVTDAAAAVLKILTEGESGGIYNVASNYAASNHITAQFCVKLFENLGIKIIYQNKPKGLSPMAPTVKVLDISRLKSLGFTPEVELKDAVVTTAKILYELKN